MSQFHRHTSWEEIKKAHRKFVRDYNVQVHFAHRERQDNRHSPQEVLRAMAVVLALLCGGRVSEEACHLLIPEFEQQEL